jgi:hypothetical protein
LKRLPLLASEEAVPIHDHHERVPESLRVLQVGDVARMHGVESAAHRDDATEPLSACLHLIEVHDATT